MVMTTKKRVSASEFKAGCLNFMDRVSRSGEPLLVTKRGRPLVRILPADELAPEDDYALQGTISQEKDIVSPVAESSWESAL